MKVYITKYTTKVFLLLDLTPSLLCDECVKHYHPYDIREIMDVDTVEPFYCRYCHEGVAVNQ